MKVVVIDDDLSVLSMMQKVLQRKGHTVLAYANPLECPLYHAPSCPCAAANPCPDIIITDYDMPKVNGIDFLVDLNTRGCKCTHLAILSGKGLDESDMMRMAKYGTRYYLKPMDFEELFDWLYRVEKKLAEATPKNTAI